MGHVSVFINGRSYRLGCEDGEEQRVHELARYVATKIEELTREIGGSAGERLYVMAALMLADEVLELREGLRQTVAQQVDTLKAVVPPTDAKPQPQLTAPQAEPLPVLAPPMRPAKSRQAVQVPGAERGPAQAQRG